MEYEIIPHKIKIGKTTIKRGLFFLQDKLFVVAPSGTDPGEIIRQNQDWIIRMKKRNQFRLRKVERLKKQYRESGLSGKERSIPEFQELVTQLVQEYSRELGVQVQRLAFRNNKFRWGSCNKKGNISISLKARNLPEELIHYLVYHELAHLLQHNHGKQFWDILARKIPDYQKWSQYLKYWDELQK